jgi:hypothetical protein
LERAVGKAGKGCSFTPSTAVLLADGSSKQIEDVEPGDEVLATDPESGETAAREVTARYRNDDIDPADIAVTSDDGSTEVIHTTQHHMFWNESRHNWSRVDSLT